MAIPAGRFRQAWIYDAFWATTAGLLLALPAALLAYLCLLAGARSATVLVLVLAPRIFRFTRNMLVQGYGSLHVEMARARGVRESTILVRHVLPAAAPQILALAAASASMAFGAAIPIEAICDVPGLGRLAWQAAMARDLPVLVNLDHADRARNHGGHGDFRSGLAPGDGRRVMKVARASCDRFSGGGHVWPRWRRKLWTSRHYETQFRDFAGRTSLRRDFRSAPTIWVVTGSYGCCTVRASRCCWRRRPR